MSEATSSFKIVALLLGKKNILSLSPNPNKTGGGVRDCDSLSERDESTTTNTFERENALKFCLFRVYGSLGCVTFLLCLWGLFWAFSLQRENNTKKKKEKKKKKEMAEVPTFKLVLVGDGGTGASFSFLRRRER